MQTTQIDVISYRTIILILMLQWPRAQGGERSAESEGESKTIKHRTSNIRQTVYKTKLAEGGQDEDPS